jgi:hypothetical protein
MSGWSCCFALPKSTYCEEFNLEGAGWFLRYGSRTTENGYSRYYPWGKFTADRSMLSASAHSIAGGSELLKRSMQAGYGYDC